MTFLNLPMLAGLLLIGAPILIYYLINRKKIVLPWGAYEWMKKAVVKRRKRTKTDNLLKLIAKILVLLFLVLLMARPAITSKSGGTELLLIVDNSLSMGARCHGKTRLELAKEAASAFLTEHKLSNITVSTYDGSLTDTGTVGAGLPASGILQNIELSPKSGSGFDLIRNILPGESCQKYDTICIISDFQSAEFNEPDRIAEAAGKLKQKLVLIPVDGRADVPNVSLDSFTFPPEGFFPGKGNRISVRLTNHSRIAKADVPVTLFVNGEKRDRTELALPPGSSGNASLDLTLPADRESEVVLSIPPDLFPMDDTLCFTAKPPKQIQLLFLSKEIPGVPYSADLFFRNAMEAFVSGAGNYYQAHSMTYRGGRLADPERYHAIITFGVPFAQETPFTESTAEFVKRGKTLISFSNNGAGTDWNYFQIASSAPLKTDPLTPDPAKLRNTLLSFMEESQLEPELIHFRKLRLIPLRKDSGDEPLLWINGQENPLVIRTPLENGQVISAGFLPVPTDTDFIFNPNFVQFVMRLLSGISNEHASRIFISGRDTRISLNADLKDAKSAVYTLEDKDGRKQYLKITSANGNSWLEVDRIFCDNMINTVKCDGETLFRLGVNLSRKDSALGCAQPEVFKTASQRSGLIFQAGDTKWSGLLSTRESLLLMALLLLAALAFDFYVHFRRQK